MKLSIVVPVYNEEENILPLHKRLSAVMSACAGVADYEIVMVNDGSTDQSAQRMSSIKDRRLKVVQLKTRGGQSGAFDRGIRAASFETIATLDADLQNDPAELPGMLKLLKQGADFVQGWRWPRQDPLSKRISSKIANAVRRAVLKDKFHDISCSQRVFKKECVKTVEFFPGAHRFLPYLVQQAGFEVMECKVRHHPRVAGTSEYGLLNRLIGPSKDLIRLWGMKKNARNQLYRGIAYASIWGFLLVGLLTINHYGYGDDEPFMVMRGQRAYQLVSALLSGRLHDLYDSAAGSEMWNYHPSFYALINYRLIGPLLRHFGVSGVASVHVVSLIIAALGLLALFKLASELLSDEIALYSLFFMMLFPRFIAHAHYNPEDIPGMAAVTAAMLYGSRFIRSGRISDVGMAGLMMGLAVSVSLGSLVLVPVCLASICIFEGKTSRWQPTTLCLFFLGIVLVVAYLLWPNLWVDPFFIFRSVKHFAEPFDQGNLLYFGNVYRRSEVPWHYYPFFLVASMPLVTLGFMGIGLWRYATDVKNPPIDSARLLLLMWATAPLIIRMNAWAVKYNQIRHLFIAIPPLMIFAGCGAKAFMDLWRKKLTVHHGTWPSLLIGICFVGYFAVQIIPVHPYEGEYFNEAFRIKYPNHIEDHFEFPVWGFTCYRESLDWLSRNAAPQAVVQVPRPLIGLYNTRADLRLRDEERANYAVVAGHNLKKRQQYERLPLLFEVQRYHSRMVGVYQSELDDIH